MLISLMTSRYKTIDPFTANSRVRLISIVEFNWLKKKKKVHYYITFPWEYLLMFDYLTTIHKIQGAKLD